MNLIPEQFLQGQVSGSEVKRDVVGVVKQHQRCKKVEFENLKMTEKPGILKWVY